MGLLCYSIYALCQVNKSSNLTKGRNMNASLEHVNEWSLARIIVPRTKRENIYSKPLGETTCYAAVVVATAISKIWGWRVEVIDENNYRKGPRDKNGLPDHVALQKENPARLVGFYCGLSSTMERVWDLAAFYKDYGVATIAGSWHAHYLPEETLRHHIDLVVHGDAEPVLNTIISNLENERSLSTSVKGVSYLVDGLVWHNNQELHSIRMIPDRDEALNELMNVTPDLNDQPYADFGLVRFAKIKIYPVSRIRGCCQKCEFCSVRGKPRWSCAKHFFNQIQWLVETRKARNFFVVDDRMEENIEATIEAFEMIAKKYGRRIGFTVQMRLEAAKNERLLDVLYRAGVRIVCIGYETPIVEELKAMQKGLSAAKMLEYTKIWRRRFRVHMMLMVFYPLKDNQPSPPAKVVVKTYKGFIRQARPASVQVLISGPVPGSELERRLRREGRLLFSDEEMWPYADGNFILFKPIGVSAREVQETALHLMKWFYGALNLYIMIYRLISFISLYWLPRGWGYWKEEWSRDKIRFLGYCLLKKWQGNKDHMKLLEKIEAQK